MKRARKGREEEEELTGRRNVTLESARRKQSSPELAAGCTVLFAEGEKGRGRRGERGEEGEKKERRKRRKKEREREENGE